MNNFLIILISIHLIYCDQAERSNNYSINTISIHREDSEIIFKIEHVTNRQLDKSVSINGLMRRRRSPQEPAPTSSSLPNGRNTIGQRVANYQQRVRNATAVAVQRYAQRIQQNAQRIVQVLTRGHHNSTIQSKTSTSEVAEAKGVGTEAGGTQSVDPKAKQESTVNEAKTEGVVKAVAVGETPSLSSSTSPSASLKAEATSSVNKEGQQDDSSTSSAIDSETQNLKYTSSSTKTANVGSVENPNVNIPGKQTGLFETSTINAVSDVGLDQKTKISDTSSGGAINAENITAMVEEGQSKLNNSEKSEGFSSNKPSVDKLTGIKLEESKSKSRDPSNGNGDKQDQSN